LSGDRVPCGLAAITYDWDFATSDHGFTSDACDAGGNPTWEYGVTTYVPGAPAGNVWGTVLQGDYAIDSGESLITPAFTVGATTSLLEVDHYYDIENLWDGGNVTVNGQVITPMTGYPGVISIPTSYTAWCVDSEEGFTGLDSGWLTSCFDLSAFAGQVIQVFFDFGSDDMYVEAGWYISAVRVGTDQAVPAESRTFGSIKAIYR
jgi:bacillopeptidase F